MPTGNTKRLERTKPEAEMDARMDAGLDTFALSIPPGFQCDVLARRSPALPLNVDATRMSQVFAESAYVHVMSPARSTPSCRGAAHRPRRRSISPCARASIPS
jgi:ABC-2 type transport system permease protein